ncbi:hypothetical protein [Desulfitibacter alkalitolerans]|uniref:hypothetical protein n=1 Tax=Desulfitibacter alkalitolerans TaxID=264641 RepID=UPI00048581A2|nr:hypothetical protein [Desulfitibacter alkalitolerans]
MQIFFTVIEGIEEYVKKGKDYPFPLPPFRRCHNQDCNKVVKFKKHGFYQRHLITNIFRDKIFIRRYICPLCGHTISYLPSFCLPRFVHGLKEILLYIEKAFLRRGTLKACLDKLNSINDGLNLSRQLVYHYMKRFMQNLSLIQTGLRQLNPGLELPKATLSAKERAKKLVVMMKDDPDQENSFSQKFYETTNKTFLTLCK